MITYFDNKYNMAMINGVIFFKLIAINCIHHLAYLTVMGYLKLIFTVVL